MNAYCWLPELEYFEGYGDDGYQWHRYETVIFEIFEADFINSYPHFEGHPVRIRKHPIENGKPEAFFHVTCQDYGKAGHRDPDLRRCERIRWVRAFKEET